MSFARLVRITVCFIVLCSLSIPRSSAQEKERLSVEWINSPASSEVAATPAFQWLDDGRGVIYDRRKPPAERTLEILDPATGVRFPLVDAPKALASLRTFRGDESPRALPFPAELDRSGRRGLYLFGGDVYLLDFAGARFQRITNTKEEEKDVLFSPDGGKISFVRSNDLYCYDIGNGTEDRLTQDGSDSLLNGTLSWVYWEEVFGRHDSGYWWSPDSKTIAYFQTDESGVSVQHYVDVKPWTPRVITQRYPKVGEKNPSVRIGLVEISSGKTTWVDFGNHSYEYIVRLQWLPDSKRVSAQTMNRPQTELNLFFADRVTGKATAILKEKDSAWVNVLDDLVFLREGKQFIWPSERDGHEHLYRYTLDGELINQVTRGQWSVRSAGGGVAWLRGGIVGVDEKDQMIYFTALEKSSIEKHLYCIRFDGTMLKRLSTEDGTHTVTFSPDRKFYTDRYSSASTPISLRLYDREGKLRSTLSSGRPDLVAQFNLQYPRFFTIPARDGFSMPAQIVAPGDLDRGIKYPVIFFVYSGPSAPQVSNSWQRDVFWENLLLQNGYLVVRCDNRSATGISKTLETTVLRRLVGEGELNDLVDAVQWVKHQPYVESTYG